MDSTRLESKVIAYNTFLAYYVKVFESEVEDLKGKPIRLLTTPLEDERMGTSKYQRNIRAMIPSTKTVLAVSDVIVDPLRPTLRKLLPRDTCSHELDINSVIAEMDKYFKISDGPVAIFLQLECRECTKFEKDYRELIAEVQLFVMKPKGLHPESNLHDPFVFLSGSACMAANELQARRTSQKDAAFAVVPLYIAPRQVVERSQ